MINKILLAAIIYILLAQFSCTKSTDHLKFKEFNFIVQKSILFALDNGCFNLLKFQNKNRKKVFGFILTPCDTIELDTTLRFIDFDNKGFFKKSNAINFGRDTFKIDMLGEHLIYPAFENELFDFSEYHRKFGDFESSNSEYDFINTLIVTSPRVKIGINSNLILMEIDRVFEYVIDRTFLLITTDKSFNVLKIECLEKVKPYIPPPPKDILNNFIQIYPDTMDIDW
jgi:hypothetical protein